MMPRWPGRLWRRLRYLVRSRHLDREMDEEIRFHIEMETRKLMEGGVPPREARRRALVAFGGVDRHKERTREARGTRMLENLARDLVLAVRSLRRSPAFAVTASVSLACGMASVAVVLSLGDALLFRSLPVPEPHRLVAIQEARTGPGTTRSRGQIDIAWERLGDYQEALEGDLAVAGHDYESFALGVGGVTEGVLGSPVTRSYFRVLGLAPAAGRFFDEGSGPAPVVVSHHVWQTRLGGDPDAVGRILTVDGRPFTLVAVAPEGFGGVLVALAADLWIPADALAGDTAGSRASIGLSSFGRLGPGVSLAAAAARVDAVARSVPPEVGGAEIRGAALEPLSPLPTAFRGTTLGFMAILLVMAGLVLSVAAANVGAVLLVRGLDRRSEVAMRLALGAGRARLVAREITGSLVLFTLGGMLGLLLAFWLTRLASAYSPPIPVRVDLELGLDPRVAGLSLAAMLLAGTALGAVTGLRSTAFPPRLDLREARAGGGPGSSRARSLFVVGQLAVTTVLLIAAGLFARTVATALAVDPGLEPEGLVAVRLSPGDAGYPEGEAEAFLEELLARLRGRPGLQAAAALTPPLYGGSNVGDAELADGTSVTTMLGHVEGEWFAAAGTELVSGRAFGSEEAPGGRPAAVVNQALARRLWPAESPLGRTFTIRGVERIVVGVAETGRYRNMVDEDESYVFLSFHEGLGSSTTIYLRDQGGSIPAAVAALRSELRALDPDVAPQLVTPVTEQIEYYLAPQRLASWLTGAFGVLGLVLAGVGVYGINAYRVARRTREIGIRMALGARREGVARLVVSGGLVLAGVGLGLGAAAAVALWSLLSRFVFGVGLTDPWIVAVVPLTLGAVSLLASWLPARRAAGVDPAAVLREG